MKTMTDNEIIKALECCEKDDCDCCPNDFGNCYANLAGYSIDLIKRLQAQIERLHSEVEEKTETIVFLRDQAIGWCNDLCNLKAKLNTAKTEAIKEFAEELKRRLIAGGIFPVLVKNEIDNIIKENKGGNK